MRVYTVAFYYRNFKIKMQLDEICVHFITELSLLVGDGKKIIGIWKEWIFFYFLKAFYNFSINGDHCGSLIPINRLVNWTFLP